MNDNEVPQWLNDEHRLQWERAHTIWNDAAARTGIPLLRDIAERNRAGFLSLPDLTPMMDGVFCRWCGLVVGDAYPEKHRANCPHTIWAPLLAGVPGAQP